MVSPGSSRSTAASASIRCCSVAVTMVSRRCACSAHSGDSSACGSRMAHLVVDGRHGSQLLCLRLRTGVAQKIAAADLGTGEVLQQMRLPQRRMTLDVKVKAGMVLA